MVQNQVTVLGWNRPNGGLPPSQAIGGRPKKRGRQEQLGIATPLRQLRELAERVEFPEKNATVCQFRASFGGRGQISREKCRFCQLAEGVLRSKVPPDMVAILNHAQRDDLFLS